jgi:16S rRNA processing protein RimM
MDETDEEAGYFVGFEVVEENHGKIGTITDVDQSTENILFVIETDDDEILIPAVEEYITDIDHEKKIIRLRLPDGLLDL